MDNDFLFVNETEQPKIEYDRLAPWRVLIVDDELDIHTVTKMALNQFEFKERKVKFLSAFSGKEACEIMSEESDIALILLDVDMESKYAGLDAARYIRNELRNKSTRIVLRTGQPGEAPEKKIIVEYDINDYKEKSELTSQKLFTTLCASFRSYQDIIALEKSKKGLEKIVEATSSLFRFQSFEKFANGALEQLSSLLNVQGGTAYSIKSSLALHKANVDWVIAAGTDKYKGLIGSASGDDISIDFDEIFTKKEGVEIINDNRLIAFFEVDEHHKAVLVIDGILPHDLFDFSLIELFVKNLTIAYENITLFQKLKELA